MRTAAPMSLPCTTGYRAACRTPTTRPAGGLHSRNSRRSSRRARTRAIQLLRAPELLRRQVGALGHRLELGPGDGRVTDTGAEPTVGPGDDVLAADEPRVRHQTLGDELRMLDEVAVVADHPGHEDLPRRQLHVLPHPPLVLRQGFDASMEYAPARTLRTKSTMSRSGMS